MGLVGPKARLKSVTDGQQVNIPALRFNRSRVLTDNLMSLWFLPLCVPIVGMWGGRNYVPWKGCFQPRCGVTEWEDQSVCIDWT